MGTSEQALGHTLVGRRHEAIILTKFGTGYLDRPNFRDGVASGSSPRSTRACRDSVPIRRRVHRPLARPATPFEETLGALEEVVQPGKIRFVASPTSRSTSASSVWRPDPSSRAVRLRRVRPADGVDVLPWCEANDVGFLGYGVLAYGLLSGSLPSEHRFPPDDWRSKTDKWGVMSPLFEHLFGPGRLSENVAVVDDLRDLAAASGHSVAQLALRWASATPGVTASLVGCRSVAEVDDDVAALDWTLDAADRDAIDQIFIRHGVNPCPKLDRTGGLIMGDELAGKVAVVTGAPAASGAPRSSGSSPRGRTSSSPTSTRPGRRARRRARRRGGVPPGRREPAR